MFSKASVILTVCFITATQSAKFPSNWKPCKLSDPDLSGCLKVAVENAVHDLMPGKASLGFPSIDPLRINSMTLNHEGSAVNFNLSLSDFDIMDLKHFKITNMESDWTYMHSKEIIPTGLRVKGKYKINGKFLLLPIVGEGDCDFKLDNVTAEIMMHFSEKYIKGAPHYHTDDFHIKLDTTRLHINLENLFNGDKLLGSNMNTVLNENWDALWAEIKVTLEKGLDYAFLEYSNLLFSRIPKSEISPK